jgi:hypothetical protein
MARRNSWIFTNSSINYKREDKGITRVAVHRRLKDNIVWVSLLPEKDWLFSLTRELFKRKTCLSDRLKPDLMLMKERCPEMP